MSPAFNGSSAIRRFKDSDVIKICNRITFDFYMELPHIVTSKCCIHSWRGFYVWEGWGAYFRDTTVLRRQAAWLQNCKENCKLDAKSSPYHVKIHLDQSGSVTIRQCRGFTARSTDWNVYNPIFSVNCCGVRLKSGHHALLYDHLHRIVKH